MFKLACPNCGQEYIFSLKDIMGYTSFDQYECDNCESTLIINWAWDLAWVLGYILALIPFIALPTVGFINSWIKDSGRLVFLVCLVFLAAYAVVGYVGGVLLIWVLPLRFEDVQNKKTSFGISKVKCPICGNTSCYKLSDFISRFTSDDRKHYFLCKYCSSRIRFNIAISLIFILPFICSCIVVGFVTDYIHLYFKGISFNSEYVISTLVFFTSVYLCLYKGMDYILPWLPIKLVAVHNNYSDSNN